ncbi:hypothetical protein Bca52824_033882 [Brassica carinata]|uniref:Uncharacterized protein n=1 Tax=Brassica carinata TaxID=52824 RepID=A0A8X7SEZ7_BRACI|nr:hypothetical protein Bca52824_033882 [Brassica carinata]
MWYPFAGIGWLQDSGYRLCHKYNDFAAVEYVEDMYTFYKEVDDHRIFIHQQADSTDVENHLGSLAWHFTVPTQNVFLGRSIKAVVPDMQYIAHFFAKLVL